ncbi:MAG: ABC transporter substrate-binding protein, partial [Halobacteriaceae archaeon]
MIDKYTAVDESTVQFDLKYAYAPFHTKLAWQIVPKSVRENNKKAFNKAETVGAGPYKLVDWKQGSFTKLRRWEDYWDSKPKVAELELVPVKESTTRVTTLRNGKHDVIQSVPPKLFSTVKSMQNASIKEKPGLGYYYLAFN